MKFYKIWPEIKPSIIGNIEGCQSDSIGPIYNLEKSNSVRRIYQKDFDFNEFPKIDFNSIYLKKNAKLTDVVWSIKINSLIALIFNRNLFSVIKKFNLPEYRISQASIVDSKGDNIEDEYFAFTTLKNQYYIINVEKSIFLIGPDVWPFKLNKLQISSSEELERYLINKHWSNRIDGEKIILNKNFKYDLFRLALLGGYYVIEKLKLAIENENLKGIRFEEVSNLLIEN